MTLGYYGGSSGTEPDGSPASPETECSKSPLADASIHLLLVLTNHCTEATGGAIKNPYREALFKCQAPNQDQEQHEQEDVSFRTDFSRLFSSLCQTLHTDESTLLLYLLLHQNPAFRTHVLASSEVEPYS